MNVPTIDHFDLRGKRVLIRSDLNVPLRDGKVVDDSRVQATAPTIRSILDRGGRAVVIAHLGRPEGQRETLLSLRPVADALSRALGSKVKFAADCVGEKAESIVSELSDGECVLLENLRFHPGEKENDPEFADALARLGDLYVDDAFSAAHRAHASISGLAKRLPSAAGNLMKQELSSLERLLSNPRRPYVAIIGGAKVETKIGVVEALLDSADYVMVGGVMAGTLLKAEGLGTGCSKIEEEQLENAKRLLGRAKQAQSDLMLPVDVVVSPQASHDAEASVVNVSDVPNDLMIGDVGPTTIRGWLDVLGHEGTVVWNGPLGAVEVEAFQEGTLRLAAAIGERTRDGALISVVGGGDTISFLHRHAPREMFTYTSLAGGAFLQWLTGDALPGVEALRADR